MYIWYKQVRNYAAENFVSPFFISNTVQLLWISMVGDIKCFVTFLVVVVILEGCSATAETSMESKLCSSHNFFL